MTTTTVRFSGENIETHRPSYHLEEQLTQLLKQIEERNTSPTSPKSTRAYSAVAIKPRPIQLTLDNIHTALQSDEPAQQEEISIVIGFCTLNIGEKPSPQQCKQVGLAIEALKPTRRQLYDMYRRFILNPNYADFAVHRFTNKALPLFTEQDLEQRIAERTKSVSERLTELIRHTQLQINRIKTQEEYVLVSEYYHLLELKQEAMTRFIMRTEEKKEKEREKFRERIKTVELWLKRAPHDAIRDAFEIAKAKNIFTYRTLPGLSDEQQRRHRDNYDQWPGEEIIENARMYAEPLFDIVEQIMMHRLNPSTTSGITTVRESHP